MTVIDAYLDFRAETDPAWTPDARPYLVMALRKALLNDDVAIEISYRGRWHVVRACDARLEFTSVKMTSRWVDAAIDHVRDWIVADVSRSAPWLSRTDEEGRPLKLTKIGSLSRAVVEADKAMRRFASSLGKIELDERHEKTEADLGDGWTLVRLLSPEALDRESSMMGHCIGRGAYDRFLRDEEYRFLSLRDARNGPHATLELRKVGSCSSRLVQLSGKRNARPVQRYLSILRTWLRNNVVVGAIGPVSSNDDAWWSGWVFDAEGRRYEVSSPPDDMVVDGNIVFEAVAGAVMPSSSLKASGEVRISGSFDMPRTIAAHVVKADPGSHLRFRDGSRVEGSMTVDFSACSIAGDISISTGHARLQACRFESIPASIRSVTLPFLTKSDLVTVPSDVGNLDLSDTAIETLPDGIVLDQFVVRDCVLRKFPAGLVVRRMLNLGTSLAASLPDDVSIEGDLTILYPSDCKDRCVVLPEGLRVGGDLRILSYPNGTLPDGLRVGGDMVLDGSANTGSRRRLHARSFAGYQRELPKDLHVEGNLTLFGRYVFRIPSCLVVEGALIVRLDGSEIPVVEDGATFGRMTVFSSEGKPVDVATGHLTRSENRSSARTIDPGIG